MEGVREINGGRYEHVSFYTCMPFSRIKKIYKKIRRLKGGGAFAILAYPFEVP